MKKTDTTQKASNVKSRSKGVLDVTGLSCPREGICSSFPRGTDILKGKGKLVLVHARVKGEKK